jgi:hypothetical protein
MAGCACAAHNVIEPRFEFRSELLLVYADLLCELFLNVLLHDVNTSIFPLSLSLPGPCTA